MKKKKINDYYLGEIFVYKDNKKKFMKNYILQESEDICKENLKLTEVRKELNHPNLIKLLKTNKIYKTKFCSNSIYIENTYEYFTNNLEDIFDKKLNKNPLSELEMAKLVYDLIDGMAFWQENNVVHGFLVPSLIFYDMRTNNFKICEKINHNLKNNYAEYIEILNYNKSIYFSPNIWSDLFKGNYLINHIPLKSDAFSIGLILLEIGILQKVKKIYSKSKGLINISLLEEYIENFEEVYKELPIWGKVIRRLLEIDEEERWDFLNIKEFLPNFTEIDDYLTDLMLSKNKINNNFQINDSINNLSNNNSRINNSKINNTSYSISKENKYYKDTVKIDSYKDNDTTNKEKEMDIVPNKKEEIIELLKNKEYYDIIKSEIFKREKKDKYAEKPITNNYINRPSNLIESNQFNLKLNNKFNKHEKEEEEKHSFNKYYNQIHNNNNIKSSNYKNLMSSKDNFRESNNQKYQMDYNVKKKSEINNNNEENLLPNYNSIRSNKSSHYSEFNNIYFNKDEKQIKKEVDHSNVDNFNIGNSFCKKTFINNSNNNIPNNYDFKLIKGNIYSDKNGKQYERIESYNNDGNKVLRYLPYNENNYVQKNKNFENYEELKKNCVIDEKEEYNEEEEPHIKEAKEQLNWAKNNDESKNYRNVYNSDFYNADIDIEFYLKEKNNIENKYFNK